MKKLVIKELVRIANLVAGEDVKNELKQCQNIYSTLDDTIDMITKEHLL